MNFKPIFSKLNPKVPKRALLFIAATLWAIAGFKISWIAFQSFRHSAPNYLLVFPIVVAGFFSFFKFFFLKIFLKHTSRIINKENELNSMFSFLDLKGYLIMIVMITLGVTLRKSGIVPLVPLGTMYAIMGLTLLTAAVRFLDAGIRYRHYSLIFKTGSGIAG